jgi:hypothetical protein
MSAQTQPSKAVSITFTLSEQQCFIVGAAIGEALAKAPSQSLEHDALFVVAEALEKSLNQRIRETGAAGVMINYTGKTVITLSDLYNDERIVDILDLLDLPHRRRQTGADE